MGEGGEGGGGRSEANASEANAGSLRAATSERVEGGNVGARVEGGLAPPLSPARAWAAREGCVGRATVARRSNCLKKEPPRSLRENQKSSKEFKGSRSIFRPAPPMIAPPRPRVRAPRARPAIRGTRVTNRQPSCARSCCRPFRPRRGTSAAPRGTFGPPATPSRLAPAMPRHQSPELAGIGAIGSPNSSSCCAAGAAGALIAAEGAPGISSTR